MSNEQEQGSFLSDIDESIGSKTPGAKPKQSDLGKSRKTKRKLLKFGEQDLARQNVEDAREKQIFIIVLIGVTTLIFLGKAYFGLPTVAGLMAAAAGIIFYAVVALLGRNRRVRLDKAGDNCYYLGLTYTLASLSAILVKIDFSAAIASQVVSGFGIAIGSTIFGIIARLCLIQFVEELDDIEHQARVSLTDSADQLKVDLDNASARMQTFMVSVQDDVKAAILNTTETQVAEQQKLIETIQSGLTSVLATIEGTSNDVSETLKTHSSVTKRFAAASEKSASAAENLVKRLGDIELPREQLEVAVSEIVAELSNLKSTLQASAEPFGSVARDMSNTSKSTELLLKSSAALMTDLKNVASGISEMKDTLGKTVAESRVASDELGQASSDLKKNIGSFQQIAGEYVEGMSEVAATLTDNLDEQ